MSELLEDFNYEVEDYETHYLQTTKQDENFKGLVGPAEKFDEMAEWQFELLKTNGLKNQDKLLDFGCGVLRGGTKFIDYLDQGNYTGADISLKTLLHGYRRLHDQELGIKNPKIIQNNGVDFSEFDEQYDYILAQSVLTHLPPKRFKTFFENIDKVMKEDTKILATVHTSEDLEQIKTRVNNTSWLYPLKHLHALLESQGFQAEILDAKHPNNQTVMRITKVEQE